MEIDLREKTYAFGMPCYDGKMHSDTAVSLLVSTGYLAQSQVNYQLLILRGGTLIDDSRNDIVDRFLTETQADVLVFVDSDITFDFTAMQRLLAFAHKYPIVCGAYQTRVEPARFMLEVASDKLNEDGLLPVNQIGIGFTAIQRSVFEKMQPFCDKYFSNAQKKEFYAYFRLVIENGQYIGEDCYFFNKAKEAGIQPMLDPYIELGHMGMKKYDTPFKSVLHKLGVS